MPVEMNEKVTEHDVSLLQILGWYVLKNINIRTHE